MSEQKLSSFQSIQHGGGLSFDHDGVNQRQMATTGKQSSNARNGDNYLDSYS